MSINIIVNTKRNMDNIFPTYLFAILIKVIVIFPFVRNVKCQGGSLFVVKDPERNLIPELSVR